MGYRESMDVGCQMRAREGVRDLTFLDVRKAVQDDMSFQVDDEFLDMTNAIRDILFILVAELWEDKFCRVHSMYYIHH